MTSDPMPRIQRAKNTKMQWTTVAIKSEKTKKQRNKKRTKRKRTKSKGR